MSNIELPYNFEYRDYQKPQFIASTEGINRFLKVWHRRAGKDLTDLNFTIMKAMERVGSYWHMFPEYEQARKAIWEGSTKDGVPYMDCIPSELVKRKDNHSMMVELINDSIYRLVGSDKINKRVGAGPKGVVFSEFSISNPQAWPLVEPMLLENDGWAAFNFTPRGKNHAYDLYQLAKNNPKWFTQLLTIDDTRDLDGNPIVTLEMIEELRRMGTDEETIQQEYYCSFEGSLKGAYYGAQIRKLEADGKITDFALLPEYPIFTFWDIGRSDYTAIWFMQKVAGEYRLYDYWFGSDGDVDVFARVLVKKGYRYAEHILPHDAGHLRVGMKGKTIKQQMEIALPGEKFIVTQRSQSEQADIIATRMFLLRCAFHKTNTNEGLNALKNFHKKWSDEKNKYLDIPAETWANHGADAFREMAIYCMNKEGIPRPEKNDYGIPTFNAAVQSVRNNGGKRRI